MDYLDKLIYEEKLLLRLSRLSFSNEQKKEIASLVEQIQNWSIFVKLATNHGISALVYNNLKEAGFMDRLPDEAVKFLQAAYLKSLSRNTILYEEYCGLKEILAEAGIAPVLLKGMALELTVYGNMGLRQMNDIDLFIDRNICLKAWELLISKGYLPQQLKSRLHEKLILDIGKHLPELYKDGISFEIHHRLFDYSSGPRAPALGTTFTKPTAVKKPSSFALRASADRSADRSAGKQGLEIISIESNDQVQRTEVDGTIHTFLVKEYHFLYLVKHLHYHEKAKAESQLRLYNDLCQVMLQCTQDIKSSGIVELAQKLGLVEILFEKLYILHVFWGMPLPQEIDSALTEGQKNRARELFVHFLRSPKENKVTNRGRAYRNTLNNIPGVANKIRYIAGDIFPSIKFMKERYNISSNLKACLFYPLRVGKLVYLFSR